jgi:hypothetical protein
VVSHGSNGDDVSNPAPELRRQPPPPDLAISIEEDFRALVEILSKAAGCSDSIEGEIADHLRRAREAAEQGLRLSRRLVKMAERA